MIKLYGIPQSRAVRCLWLLEELGIDYENIPTDFRSDAKKPDYMALNPNGRVPTLVDNDGTIIWESMAINLHLARKYPGGLWPDGLAEQSQAIQWSFWVMTEVESPMLQVLFNKVILPSEERDTAVVQSATQELDRPFKVLDAALSARGMLVGTKFSVGDLNVASVVSWAKLCDLDLDAYSSLARWLGACLARPAYIRAIGN